MEKEFIIIPYKSVGPINFGMKKEEVEEILNQPDYVNNGKRVDMRWGNLSVKINKKGLVNEISFIPGQRKVFYNNINLLNEPLLDKTLDKIDEHVEKLGFKVYFTLGLAITGFSDTEEDNAINIFGKELKGSWQKLVSK